MIKKNKIPKNVGPNLTVSVRSREEVYYEGEAYSLTSYNNRGIFDILPQHANFISLIDKYIKITKTDGSEIKLDITNSVLHVIANKVTVYFNINK